MALQHQTMSRQHGPTLKDYLLATRPQFLVASLLPVIFGTVIGYQTIAEQGGSLDAMAFLLAFICVIFLNLGINVLNDVYDDVNGTDRINKHAIFPFTGGSRVIQDNVLTQQQMRHWSYLLLVLTVLTGLLLISYKGYGVLIFGLIGLFLGITYSMPPVQLSSRGLGELAIALGVGIVPVLGATWLQTGSFGWTALLLSIPAGLWVANIVLVNEVPDAQADGGSGKRTLTVRFGDKATAGLYMISNLIAVAFVCVTALLDLIPFAAVILPVLFLLPEIFVTERIRQWQNDRIAFTNAIKFNITSYMLNLLWIMLWIIAG